MTASGPADRDRMLEELRRKGYSPRQLDVVRQRWEQHCDEGAHPALARAAHARALEEEVAAPPPDDRATEA